MPETTIVAKELTQKSAWSSRANTAFLYADEGQ
jgi:hypothetical protein